MADLLSEEDRQGIEFRSESEWVDAWQDALALYNPYRWHMMSARQVHPEFRREIWAAVQNRAARETRMNKWAR